MQTYEEKMIGNLYDLMERVKDDEDKATLTWAIFQLERQFNITLINGDE